MRSLLLVWLIGCVPTYTELADTGSPPEDVELEQAPVAILVTEGSTSAIGEEVVFAVTDANQPASTLFVTLTSSQDGELHSGNPDGNGEISISNLSTGSHEFSLEVQDVGGLSGLLEVEWTVTANPQQPECFITQPEDGDVFEAGEPVFMSGGGEDPNGGELTYLWSSSAFGPLAFAQEFEGNLPVGEQDLTLTVGNRDGLECEVTVTITVEEPAP